MARLVRVRGVARAGGAKPKLHRGVRPAVGHAVQEVEARLRHRGAGHQLRGRLRRLRPRRHQDTGVGLSHG